MIVLAGLGWLAIASVPLLQDASRALSYQPPVEVKDVASQLELTNRGKFIFEASQPAVLNAKQFNASCSRQQRTSLILGCYTNRQIFIYNVTDSQLEGVKEVTAAHELLHAAYERTNSRSRDSLIPMLSQVYQEIKSPEIEKRMTYYGEFEAEEWFNELHSIIGTEVLELPESLEEHYGLYFKNRQQIVRLHEKYQAAFRRIEDKIVAAEAQLKAMKPLIDKESSDLQRETKDYARKQAQLRAESSQLDRTSQPQVDQYNLRVNQLNGWRAELISRNSRLNQQIAKYNSLVKEIDNLNLSGRKLTESLDSFAVDLD